VNGTEPPPNIAAYSSYGSGAASTRVRMYDWFDFTGVQASRHEYVGAPNSQLASLARAPRAVARAELALRTASRRQSDLPVILSREASPFSRGHVEAALLKRSAHSAYDFDDAVFDDVTGWTRRIWSKRAVWLRAVEAADVVIAGSPYLADAASEHSRNVVMIPSCVDARHYDQKETYEIGGPPRAVWIGSPSTEGFLRSLTEPLLALNASTGLRLSVISAGDATLGAIDEMVDRTRWTADTFGSQLVDADFGIMPLEDTPYARGKCAYKLLQYAATGLPSIATPIGANREALERVGGFAARSASEWYEAAMTVIEASSTTRAALGESARRGVSAHYSFSTWEAEWMKAVGLRSA
jgi:glycosyltransferase involved in cell wall biosynthesis